MKASETQILQCRASPEVVAAIDEIARLQFNGTRSAVLRAAVKDYIEGCTKASSEVADPIREQIRYLYEVLLQQADVDSVIKMEVEKLWKMATSA